MTQERSAFYAHTTDAEDRHNWHLLSDHLQGTGRLAAQNAAAFCCANLAETAGLLHDLGKYSENFQRKLEGYSLRVDHSTCGALVAAEHYGGIGKLLAYGIAGHHAGLANGRSDGSRTSLADRLRSDLEPLDPVWEKEIRIPEAGALHPPGEFKRTKRHGAFQLAFLGRMLFSALVDADYRDTEAFYLRVEGKEPESRNFPSLEDIRGELDKYLQNFKPDSEVNKIRCRILNQVRGGALKDPGLFSLTVPTGGGKTLTSLAFALDHAIAHGLRRIIFVIPFTSIVEQTAAVFREALGKYGKEAVLEHHSAWHDDRNTQAQAAEKLRKAMENWDAPIIVTTSVQFFESLFADRPSRCRKLHNISGSVAILDEAQTLPLKLLRPSLAAMGELARNYRTSVVLCTATQPALQEEEFKDGLAGVRELAPEPKLLFEQLKRVSLQQDGVLSDEELASRLVERNQVLCIVNNRRHARSLFERIQGEPGASHLTTLMCARHRSKTLAHIRERLHNGEPCRLVSTSLIEAGVDVDFPCVYRAEAGLESIAQAAGRCNREGRRRSDDSPVHVFAVGDDWPTPPELEQFAQATRLVLRQFHEDPLSLEAVNAYFRELYWQKGEGQLDYHDILGRVQDGQIDNIPYEFMAEKFRMIESTMIPIIVPFDERAKRAVDALRYAERVGSLARALQPYLVQIPERGYKALREYGAVQPIRQEEFADQFLELVNLDLYDIEFGLKWDNPAFIAAERSVF